MKNTKMITLALAGCMLATSLVGCGSKESTSPEQTTSGESQELSGKITVLTNKTDVVDTRFVEYAEKFNEKYPKVKVEFEAMADYEGQVKIRMNTSEYGDVLLIPADIPANKYADFFEPLGKLEDLNDTYYGLEERAFEGDVYGIPVAVNISGGFVYNKKAFEKAGITELPKTPEQFLADMQKVKDAGIIPVYTNYASGWALAQWEGMTRGTDGNVEYMNDLARSAALFTEGKGHYEVYKLLFDLVQQGLVEKDPMTSDWEMSKQMCADGEVAVLPVASWALGQVKSLTDTPEDIGFMPLPFTTEDGNVTTLLAGDYSIAVNKNSKNIEAAKAWVDFFINESTFVADEGMISPLKDQPLPEDYQAFEDLGVELLLAAPTPTELIGKIDEIDQEAEIGLWQEPFKQRIIEAALGNRQETFEDIINDLNGKWKAAQEKVMQ